MRPFVALGAQAVVHTNSVSFFRDVFANRDSRLFPDRLDRTNAEARLVPVRATGSITLADPVRPIVVLPERTTHASTTILVFVPSEGVLSSTAAPTRRPAPARARWTRRSGPTG